MSIRKAVREDFSDILPIFREVIEAGDTYDFEETVTDQEVFDYWFGEGINSFVLEDCETGKVIGFYRIIPNHRGRGSHVANGSIMVSSKERNKGYARRMIEDFELHVSEMGFRAIQFNFVISTNDQIFKKGFQVFNNYGICSNEYLLVNLGFCLLDNPRDKTKVILSFLFIAPVFVKAEDEPVTTTAPITTTTVLETTTDVYDEKDYDTKDAQQVVTEIAEKYLGEYLDKQLIADIVALVFGAVSLCIFIGTYIKYKKAHKDTNDVVAQSIERELKEKINAFVNQTTALIEPLIEQNKELKEGYETIMKVLVLMQDATPKGKVALIDYLGGKTSNKEVKEASEQVQAEIEKQEETKKEVTEKVNGEYENIF